MLASYTTFLIDLDGVVYRGEEVVPGAKAFIDWLDRTQRKYLFLTNNSFASETQVLAKLKRLGITTSGSHVLGAGQAAIRNIAHRFPGGTIYLVGEQPLIEMAHAHGLQLAEPEVYSADVVLVGLDRFFNYKKLTGAVLALRAGAAFIAINRDSLLPIAGGGFIPGCGTMVAAIEAGSGIKPEVVGKPQPMLLREGMRLLDSLPEETVMIGDSIESDILAGKAAGTHTLLVLSGKESRTSLALSPVSPDYVYEDLEAVLASVQ
jgi:HAD superfamily hydrolase (TIGR01457 family)